MEGRRVVVRGGGKTTEGESLAREGEMLISTRKLNRLLWVKEEGAQCRVEGGMTFDELERHLRPKGLELAARPLSLSATLGGTAGIGGIDVTSWSVGTFADQVLSMEVALPERGLVECSESENQDLFEDVLYGYGQFGVVTALTLKLRPTRPVSLERRFFHTAPEAAEALVRSGRQGLADHMGVLSFNGVVNGLLLGFEDEEKHRRYLSEKQHWGFSETRLMSHLAGQALMLRHSLRELWQLFSLRSRLVAGLADPLYAAGRALDFRAAAMSRAVWGVWGARPLVIPDLSLSLADLPRAAEEGRKICARHFPLFSLYMVLVNRGPWRRRHEMGPFPTGPEPLVAGIECEPLHEGGGNWNPPHLKAFKDEVYGLGRSMGARAYRFGGAMKEQARAMCGEAEWERFLERKTRWDPQGILNKRVFL